MERPRAYFLWRFVESCSIFYHIYAFQVRQTSGVVPFDLFKCSGASSFNTANVECVCVCVWGGGGGDTPIHMLYGDVPHFSFFF